MPRRLAHALACLVAVAGLALRLADFGRYGFWTDEAWVALSTRTTGLGQWWLSLAVTPPLWAVALRAFPLVPVRPEVALRLLPLAFAALTLLLAYRVGHELSASRAGGLVAIALVAFEPESIWFAKLLKHYTAETALALLAMLQAARWLRRRRPRDLRRLAAALVVGAAFSNAQLLLAPPLIATLLLDAARRGERAQLGRVVTAAMVVGLADLAYFAVVVAPRIVPSLADYWRPYYLPVAPAPLAREAAARLGRLLAPSLDLHALVLVLAGAAAASARLRLAALATLLLVVETALLAATHRFPFGDPRTTLFVTTLVLVLAGAATGVVARAGARRFGRPAGAVALAAATLVLVWPHQRTGLATTQLVEDLGPFVRLVERARRPRDAVLVYTRSLYVYAYYRSAPPRLVPMPTATVGYVPVFPPREARLIDADSSARVLRAVAAAPRLWLLASRLRAGDDLRVVGAVRARGRVLMDRRRPGARLLLVRRLGPPRP